MVGEAGSARLQLLRYEADDVFAGSPEYQLMVFTRRRAAQRYCEAGTGRASPTRRGRRCGGARVLRTACSCPRAGDRASAWWFLTRADADGRG